MKLYRQKVFYAAVAMLFAFSLLTFTQTSSGIQNNSPETQKKIIKLTLAEALELAIKNNLDIKIDYFNVQKSEGSYTASKALNDINMSANASRTSNENVSTNLLAGGVEEVQIKEGVGATITNTDSDSLSFSLTQTIPTGATWSAEMRIQQSENDSLWTSVRPSRSAQVTFSIEQPLLGGFGFSFDIPQKNIIISSNNLKISKENFRSSVMQRLYGVIQAYWNLVYAQKDLEVKQQSLELAQDQLKRNKTQVDVGTMAPIEIVSAEAGVATAEQDIISAQAALKEARDELIKMLYIPGKMEGWDRELLAIDEPSTSFKDFSVLDEINKALENNPNVRQAMIDIDSKELEASDSAWKLLPNLSVNAQVTYKGTGGDFLIYDDPSPFNPDRKVIASIPVSFGDAFDQIWGGRFLDWVVGFRISFPLFNMQAKGQHAQNKANLTISKTNYLKAQQTAIADVRKAIRQIETSKLQMKASEKSRILAERQLEAEQKKFDVGSSTNFQVLQYQRELTTARTIELKTKIDYNLALYNLQLQTGTLLEQNKIYIEPFEGE